MRVRLPGNTFSGVLALLLLATLATLATAGCGRTPAPAGVDRQEPATTQDDDRDQASSAMQPGVAPDQLPSGAPRLSMVTPTPVDRSCQVDADCAVKDVGNCCGAYPACVSIHSPTDPAGVMAQCAQQGIAGTRCGIPVVTGCQCIDNVCGDIARDGEFLQ